MTLAVEKLELENASPQTIVRWALATYGPKVAMSCSFQNQSLPLLHIVSQTAPEIPIIFLDTGYHFPETLAFRDRLVSEWKLNLRIVRSNIPRVDFLTRHGPDLYRRDPDLCCYINKVEPMRQAMQGLDAWISGIRRDQSTERSDISVVEPGPDGITRVHPLAAWTGRDVWKYIHDNALPDHPLLAEGYLSVGCAPCTVPALKGEERSGRWAGQNKTECGLHTLMRAPKSTKQSE